MGQFIGLANSVDRIKPISYKLQEKTFQLLGHSMSCQQYQNSTNLNK